MKILPLLFLATSIDVQAKLIVKLDEPKTTGSKTIVKLTIKNGFSETVESARATLFLFDDQGKVVGRSTQWVIGGSKDKASLKPDASTTFNFVFDIAKPIASTTLTFTRIILEGGKLADPQKDVEIQK